MSFADDGGARAANSDKLKEVMFGARVRYPITITRLLKKPGDKIRRQETLLQYSFRWQREAGDPLRDETWLEEVTTVADWDSPAEGVLVEWRVDEGDTVREDMPAMVVAEACPHSIQYGGLCALCGADMTEKNWAQDDLDTARAPINMVHDQTNLKVSASRAARAEEDLQRRLLRQRKLSLVVDLDQTIIHACIEPTIGEWQRDPTNPNYEAVKDVKSFQLNDDGTVGHHHMGTGAISGCWYYIKLRPGLLGFLERIATMYEMHVYTMGTRAYALNIARIVDPQKRLFGNRVLSRDENGSMTAKSLQRLFPVSTSMVAIIDDRSDVWPRNRGHLIKVTPYDFFKGIGDINSSFLPPREEVMPVQPIPVPPLDRRQMGVLSDEDAVAKDKAAVAGPSPLSADEEAVLRLQEEEQERVLERQLKERPLLHMQEELDKEDEAMGDAEPAEPPSVSPSEQLATESSIEHGQQKQQDSKAPIMSPSSPAQQQQPGQPLTHHHPHHRHNLLRDDDDELKYVEEHLSDLHDAFYVEYDRRVEALRKEDEAAALRSAEQSAATRTQLKRPGVARHQRQRSKSAEADDMSQQQPSGQKQPSPSEGNGYVDFRAVPDVVAILSRLRQNVLQGAVIVLSGMIPRRVDVRRSELGLQILSFGAELHARIGPRVTHLVVSTAMPGFKTEKVDEAAERGDILIVGEGWLHECMRRWAWVDEKPYIIHVPPRPKPAPSVTSPAAQTNVTTEAETASVISDEDEDAENRAPSSAAAGASTAPTSPSSITSTVDMSRRKPPPRRLLPAIGTHNAGAAGTPSESTTGAMDVDRDEDEEDEEDGDYVDSEEDDEDSPSPVTDGQSSPIDELMRFDWSSAEAEIDQFLADEDSEEGEDQENEDDDVTRDEDEEEDEEGDDSSRTPRRGRPRTDAARGTQHLQVPTAQAARSSSKGRKRKTPPDADDGASTDGGGKSKASSNGSVSTPRKTAVDAVKDASTSKRQRLADRSRTPSSSGRAAAAAAGSSTGPAEGGKPRPEPPPEVVVNGSKPVSAAAKDEEGGEEGHDGEDEGVGDLDDDLEKELMAELEAEELGQG